MKYPINFEFPREAAANFFTILLTSVLTAGVIGAVVGFIGYVPGPEFLVMVPSVAIGGMMVGLILGPLLAYVLFRGRISNRMFYGSAAVCLLVGFISAIGFRLFTEGQGAWLAAYPTVLGAVAAAIWFKIKGN